jgi:hypothetical protein
VLDVNRIERDFAHALRRGCSEKGCRLKLDGLGDHVVLKGEALCQDPRERQRMCDCIIFVAGNSVIIGIVELKSKTAHSSEVVDKLTNSSEIALEILRKCVDSNISVEFRHILLHKGLDGTERRKMGKQRIRVRGKGGKYDIITKRCGISFSTVVSGFKK